MRKRVVITGIGGICGLGTDAASIWNEMKAGRSAIGQVVGFGPSSYTLGLRALVETLTP